MIATTFVREVLGPFVVLLLVTGGVVSITAAVPPATGSSSPSLLPDLSEVETLDEDGSSAVI